MSPIEIMQSMLRIESAEDKPRELFRCTGCQGWVDWDDGCDDDMPLHCAACWTDAHGGGHHEHATD